MATLFSENSNDLSVSLVELQNDVLCCYQCGICINSCPVGAINNDFNPRLIMHSLSLGMVEELALSKEIWLCSQCYLCQERCPQEIAFCDIIVALRNLAFSRLGKVMPHFSKILKYLKDFGSLYDLDDFVNDDREMIGLPFKEHNSSDLKIILQSEEFKNI